MHEIDPLLAILRGLSILSILSWAAGNRSFLGHPLALRMGPFWLGCRCFGIGIFITLVSLKVSDQEPTLALLTVSTICLVLGCSRVKVKPQKSTPDTAQTSDSPPAIPIGPPVSNHLGAEVRR